MAYFGQGGGDGLRPFNVPVVFGPFYPGVPVGFGDFGGYGAFIMPGPPPPPYGFPAYAPPGPPAVPPPGPSTLVPPTFVPPTFVPPTFVPPTVAPPTTQGIDLSKIDEYIGRRLIAHINNGSMICGVLRYAYPNGNLLLSEAIQGSYRGPKMVLGKVVAYGTFPLLCAYRSCGARCIFPLNCDTEVLLPDSY